MRFDPAVDHGQDSGKRINLGLDYKLKGNLDSPHLLVFFNGLFHGESSWVKQQRCRKLSQMRMLFIDYPGCGNAALAPHINHFDFDDIAFAILALIEQVQQQGATQTTHFIGYSLGGMVANRLCELMAQPPHSLTFINSAPSIGEKAHYLIDNVLLMLRAKLAPELLFSQIYPWFFSDLYLQKIKGMKAYVLNSYVEYNQDLAGLGQFLQACLNQDHTPKLSPIPSMMLSCDGDPLFPPEVLTPWLEQSPCLEHHALRLSSHVANLEAPNQVNTWLAEFIQRHSQQQPPQHATSQFNNKECQHG
ncbi:alpha/beta fold hydrolase [Motilimonas eburnea]|uniref:alpha/beta fold hydrolase n=1 Tax=Motilimonas eburnea TaxID=1737488 RepID=UPI001E2F824B|nr:alpha/beta hydrolase [Motilimonas eburnea]MCE2570355.1 alpha/beta hydrolase [Motilimonas eburnea]